MHPVPIQHSTQIVNAYPLAAMEHHVQHIVLLRCAVLLIGKTFTRRFDHNIHHQAVCAVELLYIEVSLQREKRNSDRNLFFFRTTSVCVPVCPMPTAQAAHTL